MSTSSLRHVFVGGYTAEAGGTATGITSLLNTGSAHHVQLDPVGTAELRSPTWLVRHPTRPLLLAAGETNPGTLSSVRWDHDGSLTALSTVAVAGDGACHLAITEDGRHAIVASYVSGIVSVVAIAADGTLAKLGEAADAAAGGGAGRVEAVLDDESAEPVRARVTDALRRHRRIHLRYLVPARDESTERDVDPMRVINVDGRWYLEGWCHRAEDTRLFRLDRVEEVEILDADGHPPAQAQARDLSAGVFTPSQDAPLVALALGRGWEWVGEYYPIESSHADGADTIVELRAGDTDWVRRLALRAGGGVRILDPQSLADVVAADAAGALAAYGQQG